VDVDKARPNVGHFFMALDPAAFRPLEDFKRDMDRLSDELKNSPKAEGQNRIYVHGEKSYARMEKYRKEGIPLGTAVVESLRKVGTELSVPFSF
jgi:L-2-hydroxycarboxylate dehydrogenase (NAD+)